MFRAIYFFITIISFLYFTLPLTAQCDPAVAGSCCGLPVLGSDGVTIDNRLSDVENGTMIYSGFDLDNVQQLYKSKDGVTSLVSTGTTIFNTSGTIKEDTIVWEARESNSADQLYQSVGGVVTQIMTSYSTADSPIFLNGVLYFRGERTFSPRAYDLVKLENGVETVISLSMGQAVETPKLIGDALYFRNEDASDTYNIVKYQNGITTVVVPDVGFSTSNAFLAGDKIVYKLFNSDLFRDEIWMYDNGTKTQLSQAADIDRIDVVGQTSTGVIWKEQGNNLARKIWTYDGTTIAEVAPPVGLSAFQFTAQVGDVSFFYNGSSKKLYKVENGEKTLLTDNNHRSPNRIRKEGSNIYYSADDLSFDEQVYAITCGSTCPDDIAVNPISETAYGANNSITSDATLGASTTVLFSAGKEVKLLPEFGVLPSGILSIIIQSCDDFSSN